MKSNHRRFYDWEKYENQPKKRVSNWIDSVVVFLVFVILIVLGYFFCQISNCGRIELWEDPAPYVDM